MKLFSDRNMVWLWALVGCYHAFLAFSIGLHGGARGLGFLINTAVASMDMYFALRYHEKRDA